MAGCGCIAFELAAQCFEGQQARAGDAGSIRARCLTKACLPLAGGGRGTRGTRGGREGEIRSDDKDREGGAGEAARAGQCHAEQFPQVSSSALSMPCPVRHVRYRVHAAARRVHRPRAVRSAPRLRACHVCRRKFLPLLSSMKTVLVAVPACMHRHRAAETWRHSDTECAWLLPESARPLPCSFPPQVPLPAALNAHKSTSPSAFSPISRWLQLAS
eukprot:270023-Rhodomonas_salina.1